MEAEPHLPASTQGVVVALWRREERTSDWGVSMLKERKKPKLELRVIQALKAYFETYCGPLKKLRW